MMNGRMTLTLLVRIGIVMMICLFVLLVMMMEKLLSSTEMLIAVTFVITMLSMGPMVMIRRIKVTLLIYT